jgi:hypothetical protein
MGILHLTYDRILKIAIGQDQRRSLKGANQYSTEDQRICLLEALALCIGGRAVSARSVSISNSGLGD